VNVAVFTKFGRLGASSRQRFYLYNNFFKRCGISLEFYPLIDDQILAKRYGNGKYSISILVATYIRRIFLILKLRKTHVFWIQSELFPFLPAFVESFLLRKVPFVIDIDDAIFHNYDLSNSAIVRVLFGNKIDVNFAAADYVVCGSPYLQSRAYENRSSNICLIPTCIDFDRYQNSRLNRKSDKLVIGWIGSPTTARYLYSIESALCKLNERVPFELHVIGGKFESQTLTVRNLVWSEDNELDLIKEFDIGLMPLVDSQWEKGKCGYKIIQYMGCGVPYVCSGIGVNTLLVENSDAGFIANNEQEWIHHLEKLLLDENLRQKMGCRGIQSAERSYSFQSNYKAYAKIFLDLEVQP
jgi:glycosyltransferase involved in cell wall biosynthesis